MKHLLLGFAILSTYLLQAAPIPKVSEKQEIAKWGRLIDGTLGEKIEFLDSGKSVQFLLKEANFKLDCLSFTHNIDWGLPALSQDFDSDFEMDVTIQPLPKVKNQQGFSDREVIFTPSLAAGVQLKNGKNQLIFFVRNAWEESHSPHTISVHRNGEVMKNGGVIGSNKKNLKPKEPCHLRVIRKGAIVQFLTTDDHKKWELISEEFTKDVDMTGKIQLKIITVQNFYQESSIKFTNLKITQHK